MKSKKGLILAALMLSSALVGAFSGCTGAPAETQKEDETKANLSVATFDGGVGRAWLEDAIARFEAKYANATHFQEGRTGVKISLVGDKNKYQGNALVESGSLNKDVYFTEAVDYYAFVQKGMVADLSDIMTKPLTEYGESKSIADKIDGSIKDFMTAGDGNYYMIPFYDGFYGFIYDVELFEKEGFYFDKDGDFFGIDDADFATNKSNGPDGEAGTYDDGLPATYEQMIALCDYIASKDIVPFCYSGNYPAYVNRSFFSYVADYEGYDSFSVNKTLNGTTNIVKNIDANGAVETEEVAITEDNGYLLQKQAGKYYALKMQEALFGSTKYVGGTWNSFDFTVAQSTFISSKYSSKKYAMLAEGVWWENEASAAFASIQATQQESKMDRRFGFLPVPKASEDKAGKQTMFSVNSSFGFVNKNCENMELAKEFMKFLHTDAEMSKFSAKTSIPRSLNYEVTSADRDAATYYGKTLIDMRANAEVVYPFSSANLVINNPTNFENDVWFGAAVIDGTNRKSPFDAFKDGRANALSYFNGLATYQQCIWSTLIK